MLRAAVGVALVYNRVASGRYPNFPMSLFANILAADVEDTVIDRTGLTGGYDFTLPFDAGTD